MTDLSPISGPRALVAAFKDMARGTILHRAYNMVSDFGPVTMPNVPHMPLAEAEHFTSLLRVSKTYLEYGSGGSTVLAERMGVPSITSVENDPRYVIALRQKFEGSASDINMLYASLGIAGKWGTPLDQRATPKNIERGNRYAQMPWDHYDLKGEVPDLILIDGRFRINCTLTSLLQLPEKANTTFLFDDFYGQGRNYNAILPFVEICDRVDHGLLFKKSKSFDAKACRAAQVLSGPQWQ